MYLIFLSSFLCKDTKNTCSKPAINIAKTISRWSIKQIKIQKNVTMPTKIIIIYRLQGHIHANP